MLDSLFEKSSKGDEAEGFHGVGTPSGGPCPPPISDTGGSEEALNYSEQKNTTSKTKRAGGDRRAEIEARKSKRQAEVKEKETELRRSGLRRGNVQKEKEAVVVRGRKTTGENGDKSRGSSRSRSRSRGRSIASNASDQGVVMSRRLAQGKDALRTLGLRSTSPETPKNASKMIQVKQPRSTGRFGGHIETP